MMKGDSTNRKFEISTDISSHSVYTIASPVYDIKNADFDYYSLPKTNLDRSRSRHGRKKASVESRLDHDTSTSKTSLDMSILSPKCLMKKYYEGAWYGHIEIVKEFLAAGNDVNRTNDEVHKKTMLHLASYMGRLRTVQFLVARGADVNLEDAEGNTAIEIACWGGRLEVADYLVLHTNTIITFKVAVAAAKAGSLEPVKRWCSNLIIPGSGDFSGLEEALCTSNEEGQNLLHIACENDHPKIAVYLIEQGHSKKALSQMDSYGQSPIDIMIQNGMVRVIHKVMHLRLKEHGIISPAQVCGWFVHLSKKYCKLVDLCSVFFLPMSVFLQQCGLLPREQLSDVLITGASLPANTQVLYISHNFGTKQLGFLYTLILEYLQRKDKNYDYIWISYSCLSTPVSSSSGQEDVAQELPSVPLAFILSTDVLVLPGFVKDKKNGTEFLDILSYSSCIASQADLVTAGILGKSIHFGFYSTKLPMWLFFCGCSGVESSAVMNDLAFQKAVFFFETEHRSKVFEEFATACCKNALQMTSDLALFQRLKKKLLPSKTNDFEYIEPSDLLCSMTDAILSMDSDSIIKLCSRNIDLEGSQEEFSSELHGCYSLFDHKQNPAAEGQKCQANFDHKEGTYSCTCSACFINLSTLVYHIIFLLKHDYNTYDRFLNDLPLSPPKLDASGFGDPEAFTSGSNDDARLEIARYLDASGSSLLDDSASNRRGSHTSSKPRKSCLKSTDNSEIGMTDYRQTITHQLSLIIETEETTPSHSPKEF